MRSTFSLLLCFFAASSLLAQANRPPLKKLHSDVGCERLEFSPDGEALILHGGGRMLDLRTGKVAPYIGDRLFTPAAGQVVDPRVVDNRPQPGFAFSPDRKLVAIRHYPRSEGVTALTRLPDGAQAPPLHPVLLALWNFETGRFLLRFDLSEGDKVYGATFSPDGQSLFIARNALLQAGVVRRRGNQVSIEGGNSAFRIDQWSVANGRKVADFGETQTAARLLQVSPDGNWLVTAGGVKGDKQQFEKCELLLWNIKEPKQYKLVDGPWFGGGIRLLGDPNVVNQVLFSPDNAFVLTDTQGWFDLNKQRAHQDARTLKIEAACDRKLAGIASSPDGRFLVVPGEKYPRVLDWQTGDPVVELQELKGHQHPIRSAAFSPDGHFLATLADKGEIVVWNLRNPQIHWPRRN